MDSIFKTMDWSLLRQQKEWLLSADNELADGLVGLLDYIQDRAVEQGLSEEVVFGQLTA